MNTIVMGKLKLKYSDDWTKTKGYIVRIVVKRRYHPAKLTNKRCATSHQDKISIKWNSNEVKKPPNRDANQAMIRDKN